MALVTKGKTFTNGELVTPAKIHQLVDSATVSNIVNADISAGAAITDTKLATISTSGKVSNSATTATNSNTANAIVTRDASGNFNAGTITANLTGNVTGNVTGNASTATKLATARTITLGGNLSGSVSFDGSANATLTAAVADDSHNHIIANVDGLETALNGKQAAGSYAAATHTHDASNITSGTLAIARIPTGTTNSTVCIGNDSRLLPPGAIMPFAMNSAPTGWLAANGAAVSRATYAALFSAIGTTYGAGDGGSTFNLPDLRGYFVRGSGTNTDGTASGAFGAKQNDEIKSHSHFIANTDTTTASDSPQITSENFLAREGFNPAGTTLAYKLKGSSTTPTVGLTSTTGSSENRPNNIAMLYCIKF
jgi:microcystin-dependent protein